LTTIPTQPSISVYELFISAPLSISAFHP